MDTSVGRTITLYIIDYTIGCKTSMTSDCPDGLCKQKIQAIDHAIGHHKNDWSVLLNSTRESKDVEHALRFCQIFLLESKVKIQDDGYVVLIKNELVKPLQKLPEFPDFCSDIGNDSL
ncbi:MAG: hypothetical protein ACFFCX_05955 [Candidatus Sifarchaeia archaeon]